MSDNSVYYYALSAIPQSLAGLAAIIGVFAIYRINSLKELLVGDGISVLERWGEVGYKLPIEDEDDKHRKRLRDAIYRKSVDEIKITIKLLCDNEEKEGYTKKDRPAGLQHVYGKFCDTENHVKRLKRLTISVVGIALLTTMISIVFLGCIDSVSKCLRETILWIIILLFSLSLVLAFLSILLGFSETER